MNNKQQSLEALNDIRDIMEKSARFITLSGWSGIWAGCVGLIGAYIANTWLNGAPDLYYNGYRTPPADVISSAEYYSLSFRFFILAVVVLIVALAGGYYFTWRRTLKTGQKMLNSASRRMIIHMAVPLIAGGLFSLMFLFNGHEMYIGPACLIFYGLALINGSKYTVSDIKYLGYSELTLGIINMALPGYGLTCWAIGFGVLHILYGIIMWNKYDKTTSRAD